MAIISKTLTVVNYVRCLEWYCKIHGYLEEQ